MQINSFCHGKQSKKIETIVDEKNSYELLLLKKVVNNYLFIGNQVSNKVNMFCLLLKNLFDDEVQGKHKIKLNYCPPCLRLLYKTVVDS